MSDLLKVRAGFVAKGTSLHRWCQEHGIKSENATKALKGSWNGPRARELRAKLLKASGGSHG